MSRFVIRFTFVYVAMNTRFVRLIFALSFCVFSNGEYFGLYKLGVAVIPALTASYMYTRRRSAKRVGSSAK